MGPYPRAVPHLPCPLRPVDGIEQSLPVKLHICRIRYIAEGVRKGHLDRFQLPVAGFNRIFLREFKFLEDVQGHQSHNSLPVGRNLTDIVTPVV